MMFFIRVTLFFPLLLVSILNAQHENTESRPSHHSGHAIHWNHIAVFLGVTSKLEKEGTHFSLGFDYVRKFPPAGKWAVSAFGEAIFDKHTEWLFGIPVIYWPTDQIWLRAGPGIEFLEEEGHNHSETKKVVEFLWRIGIGYDREFAKYTLTPSVDIDFERSTTAVVWGLNVGYGF